MTTTKSKNISRLHKTLTNTWYMKIYVKRARNIRQSGILIIIHNLHYNYKTIHSVV